MESAKKHALVLGLIGKKLERKSEESDDGSDLDNIAHDLIDAIQSKDRARVVDALRGARIAFRMEDDN